MNISTFDDLSIEEQDFLDAYANQTISAEDFEKLQDRLLQSPRLRATMRRHLSVVHSLELESGEDAHNLIAPWLPSAVPAEKVIPNRFKHIAPVALVTAACLTLAWIFLSNHDTLSPKEQGEVATSTKVERSSAEEPSSTGYGVIGRLQNTRWAPDGPQYRTKDLLGEGPIRLLRGTAELRFFCGAVVTIEGPTELDMKSAWEAVCHQGGIRIQVPPAARGFTMHAPNTEIVDMGTEYGLVVRDQLAEIEVFTGKVAVKHRNDAVRFVTAGQAWRLPADGPAIASAAGSTEIPQAFLNVSQDDEELLADFERWKVHRDAVASDPRVIAYYTFDQFEGTGIVKDVHENTRNHDGTVILAESTDGRWTGKNRSMNFRRPGSRVRVNIPGEFPAFTFMCWVRIDSLDRWYNALFMGDGFETGEPHWQIQDNGRLMLSIQVDHERPNSDSPVGRGFHHNYYSPPIWNQTMSGKWVHLCSVFDPETRMVFHYVDGKRISGEEIRDDYAIQTLRIGNAEIGNWGQPVQRPAKFAIRNLNGHMDEIAIYGVALDHNEIGSLFERSRAAHQ